MATNSNVGNSTPIEDLVADLRRSIEGEVRFDAYTRAMNSTDATNYQMAPDGVVLPRSPDDVSAVVSTARTYGVPVLPRGGGTSLAGQAVNHAIVLDFSKYMHKVLEVNPEGKWVHTEPGVTIDALNRQLSTYGLLFAPDPSTSSRANIGGAIGNNSCGAHSIIYGKTVDHVSALDVILSDGSMAKFERLNERTLAQKLAITRFEGDIYRKVHDLALNNQIEIERRYPKIMRRVGGYNLDLVREASSINLCNLVVGSEGTLAVATAAKLRLEPLPHRRGLAVVHFHSLSDAMEATEAILEEKPAAVEHIGKMILQQARASLGFSRNLGFLQGEPSDVLVVEFFGDGDAEIASLLDRLKFRMKQSRLGYAVTTLTEMADQAKVWEMRRAGLGLMMNVSGDAKPIPFVEDTAVPVQRLPEYVKRFDEIVKSHGTEAGYYGHASVGCLHIRPLVNLKLRQGIDRMESIASSISDLVLEFGGSMSAEHGDGIVRGVWTEKMFGSTLYKAFRELKAAFDPDKIMNPGKIVDCPPLTENLRYGPSYAVSSIKTRLNFSKEGGFAAAVEACNGVGACRKVQAGAMCPSYMATREEEHSTRGRANALRSAISGRLPDDAMQSERMLQVLDLCLECKSCKSECPSNVDMAKLKYEFLDRYYRHHRLPLRSRLVANVHEFNAIAAPLASISNAVSQSYIGRWILEHTAGIDRRRRIPNVRSRTFEKCFDSRARPRSESTYRGKVIFFHDTFTNFNYPEAGIAAVRLLESFGYEVSLVPRKCCGRPMISKGMLDQAASNARHNIDVLLPHVEQGTRIIGIEASCISAIRDEYLDLFPKDKAAEKVAGATQLLQELLVEASTDGKPVPRFDARNQEVAVQIHCHERALVGSGPAIEALQLAPGFDIREIPAGCCGMAGSFGYEKEHYDISLAIGEDRLFPFARSAPDHMRIAVTGVSCHQQINHGTNRPPLFLSQLLASALVDS